MDSNTTTTTTTTNNNNSSVRVLMAAAMLVLGACDSADTDVVEDMSPSQFRSAEAGAEGSEVASSDAGVVSMGLADGESWAILSDGTIKGWGKRYCDSDECFAPVDNAPLQLDEAAEELHGNGEQLVVRQADGTVLEYGEDIDGQGPMLVEFGSVAAELALGEDFLCARLGDGSMECQGIEGVSEPQWLAGFESPQDVVELSGGSHHLCARHQGGLVSCWGDDGQLGTSPSSVVGLDSPAQSISAGGAHTCALLDSGSVQCWGANDEGQLGHPGPGVGTVPLAEAAESIAAGAEHSCAIGADTGTLYCWGSDSLGQLGEGVDAPSGIRQVDLGGHEAAAIFAGPTAWTTFAVLDHGGLRGWGYDDQGQTGYGRDLHDGSSQDDMNPGNLDDITIIIADDD